jgi:hypothetical protein
MTRLAWRRFGRRRSVVVNLRSDKALKGVLWAKQGGLLVLRSTQLLEPGHQPVPVDGDVLVQDGNVDFVQVLASALEP